MVIAALVTMACSMPLEAPKPMGMLWEETPAAQAMPGYHPMIRFGSWDITRFNRSSTYMFATPDMIQQGQFSTQGNQYLFRAVMANEIEVADKDKIITDMDPRVADNFAKAYARSMSNFPGSYNAGRHALTISYMVKGVMRSYDLFAVNEGDDRLPVTVGGPAKALIGIWSAPDPYPQRLDARTRQKIDEFGLQRFFQEASQADGAAFAVMDLRSDGSYRSHKIVGTWSLNGSTLVLVDGPNKTYYQVSRDGSQLLSGGSVAYIRG